MTLKVKKVANGYYLKLVDEDRTEEYVFNDDKSKLDAFIDLLWSINNLIGPSTNRYSEERLSIGIIPGDKYSE